MLKVAKFGGSSMADAGQYRKVRDIILSDKDRRVVVVSAAGKRHSKDHKLTDLLYLCHAHIQYGVDCTPVFEMITSRYLEVRDELGLKLDLETEFAELKAKLDSKSISSDELVSRGEYFSAKLMAAFLGYRFVDAADWVKFNMDGTVDQDASYAALRALHTLGKGTVIPGFYGVMPNGAIKTFSRGGGDISGAVVARGVRASLYENWTDVSGFYACDPRIVNSPKCIEELSYRELRELSYMGANVLHSDSIFPVKSAGIPIRIANTFPRRKGYLQSAYHQAQAWRRDSHRGGGKDGLYHHCYGKIHDERRGWFRAKGAFRYRIARGIVGAFAFGNRLRIRRNRQHFLERRGN